MLIPWTDGLTETQGKGLSLSADTNERQADEIPILMVWQTATRPSSTFSWWIFDWPFIFTNTPWKAWTGRVVGSFSRKASSKGGRTLAGGWGIARLPVGKAKAKGRAFSLCSSTLGKTHCYSFSIQALLPQCGSAPASTPALSITSACPSHTSSLAEPHWGPRSPAGRIWGQWEPQAAARASGGSGAEQEHGFGPALLLLDRLMHPKKSIWKGPSWDASHLSATSETFSIRGLWICTLHPFSWPERLTLVWISSLFVPTENE